MAGTLSWWGNRLKTDVARRARVAKGTGPTFTQLRVTGSDGRKADAEIVQTDLGAGPQVAVSLATPR